MKLQQQAENDGALDPGSSGGSDEDEDDMDDMDPEEKQFFLQERARQKNEQNFRPPESRDSFRFAPAVATKLATTEVHFSKGDDALEDQLYIRAKLQSIMESGDPNSGDGMHFVMEEIAVHAPVALQVLPRSAFRVARRVILEARTTRRRSRCSREPRPACVYECWFLGVDAAGAAGGMARCRRMRRQRSGEDAGLDP